MKYPKTVAAVEKAENTDQWAIGAALLAEVGKPSPESKNDGSRKQFEQCSKELAARGFDYSVTTLVKHRGLAFVFPPSTRVHGVPYAVHRIAGGPEMLDRILKANGRKVPTYREAERLGKAIKQADAAKAKKELEARNKARLEARAEAERKREEAKAKRKEAAEAKRKAKEEQDAKAKAVAEAEALKAAAAADDAEGEADEADEAATGPVSSPPSQATKTEINLVVQKVRILRHAEVAQKGAREAEKLLREILDVLDEYSDDEIALIRDTFLETANAWTALAGQLKPKRSLELVGAGR